jgi:hypothetical protein
LSLTLCKSASFLGFTSGLLVLGGLSFGFLLFLLLEFGLSDLFGGQLDLGFLNGFRHIV